MPALVGGFGNESSKYLLPPINNNTFFLYCISGCASVAANFFSARPNLSCNAHLPKETRDYNGQNLVACMQASRDCCAAVEKQHSCSSESSLLGPYLAGLIEGDGTIAVHDTKSTAIKYRPIIIIVFKDRKSTRLNSSHSGESRMPSSA